MSDENKENEPVVMRICSACGMQFNSDFDFCPKCGKKFGEDKKAEDENKDSSETEKQNTEEEKAEPVKSEEAHSNESAEASQATESEKGSKRFCSTCGAEIEQNALFCPKCGGATNGITQKPKKRGILKIFLTIFLIILVILVILAIPSIPGFIRFIVETVYSWTHNSYSYYEPPQYNEPTQPTQNSSQTTPKAEPPKKREPETVKTEYTLEPYQSRCLTFKLKDLEEAGIKRIKIYANCKSSQVPLDFEIVSTLKNFNDFANFDSYRCYPAYSQLNSYYYNHEFRTDGFQFYNNEKEVYFAIRNPDKKLDSWVTVTETFYYDD